MQKCDWAMGSAIEEAYHDNEWGTPVHDDRLLFEFLILEGVQAGLNWRTVLQKRENYRVAFDNFQPEQVAAYDEAKIDSLLQNPGIIRNQLKIRSAVKNAQAYLEVQQAFGSFDDYIWLFVDYRPMHNHWQTMQEIPASTRLSNLISKDLKKRGFKFVGPTICYAFMQAVGMVNDHLVSCPRHKDLI